MNNEIRSYSFGGAFLFGFFGFLIMSSLALLLITRELRLSLFFSMVAAFPFGFLVASRFKGDKIIVENKKEMDKIDNILTELHYLQIEEKDHMKKYSVNTLANILSPNIFIIDDKEIIGPAWVMKKIKKSIL